MVFKQMDPCCLAPDLEAFDAITMVGLLVRGVVDDLPRLLQRRVHTVVYMATPSYTHRCTLIFPQDRIVSPKAPLGRLAGERALLRRGGLLLVGCSYQWSDRVADPSLWLGGREGAGPSARGLAQALGPSFELVEEAEVPMVGRVNARRMEVEIAHVSVWQRVE